MKNTYAFSSEAQPMNLVKMAQLVLDYEADPDYIYSDLQKGVMTDILKVVKNNPHQLLQTLPTIPVARVLYLAFHRGVYAGKREMEILATATYYSLSRAMAENPRNMSLYRQRYSLLQESQHILSRLLSVTLKKSSNLSCSHEYLDSTIQANMIRQMLLTDLLHAEEFFKDRVILLTERRTLMDQLEQHHKREMPLYQHLNAGLENHELFYDCLQEMLQLPEAWIFYLREDSTTNDIHK